ncbi:MAG: DUF4097 domain-containing protein [bacterium]|nr:DUF4097 domain-containing protein [bacterium]
MKILARPILVILLSAIASAAAAEQVERSFNQRFDVEPGARLELEHADGDAVITPWDQDAIEVDVIYKAEYRRVGVGRDPDLDVHFEQRGDTVRVIGDEKDAGGIGFFSIDEIEYVYRVRAPSWVELDLKGDDGNVEISGWQAEINVRNDDGDVSLSEISSPRTRLVCEDGDVEIEDFEGDLDLRADDGDVTVRDCRGERIRIDAEDGRVRVDRCEGGFEIATDDGDIELERLRADRLEVHTGDGRIEIEVAEALERLELDAQADDGDIVVTLGADVAATFDLSSDDGRIQVVADAVSIEDDRHQATGKLGDGSGSVRVRTGGGRISLQQAKR